MRHISYILPLLLASSAVLAQSDGVMILKSDQPYVSPFDKTPTGRPAPAAMAPPAAELEVFPRGEGVNVEVREIEKKKTQTRAQAFVDKTQSKPVVVRKGEVRRSEPARAVVKKEEPKPVVSAKVELKPAPIKAEASIIPPKDAQNPKAELAPPPALAVKETGLTSFSKGTPVVALPSVTAPAAVIDAPAMVTQTEASVPTMDTSSNESMFPTWILKAIMFFAIGGLLMLGTWYWIKHQALYGDPAFHDPWFRPIKNR